MSPPPENTPEEAEVPVIRNLGPPSIYLPSRNRAGDTQPDALMVQGFATGGGAMRWIRRHLEGLGMTTAVPQSGGLLGYLQTKRVAHAAARIATRLRAYEGTKRTWLVGHSIGGLICRYVVQAEETRDRVAGVITIGTPHRGTVVAAPALAAGLWIASRAPFDVLPRSRILATLNGRPWPTEMPLISIYSPTDLLCLHPAGKVPFADHHPTVENVHLAGLGHTELLWDPGVLETITRTILDQPERRRAEAGP